MTHQFVSEAIVKSYILATDFTFKASKDRIGMASSMKK